MNTLLTINTSWLSQQAVSRNLYSLLSIVFEAGNILLEDWNKPRQIEHKGRIDLVTQTDKNIENFLIEQLGKNNDGALFLGEETHTVPKDCFITSKQPVWIIDPLDGTTNFTHKVPFVNISVALWHNAQPQLAVVYAPLLNECFYAEAGKGAWLNGEQLQVSGVDSLEKALLATGFPYSIQESVDDVVFYLRKALVASQGVRRCGAAAIDLAYVAAGRFDGYFEKAIQPWDAAAGFLLVQEAGGTITQMNGDVYFPGGPTVLASNKKIHNQLIQMFVTK